MQIIFLIFQNFQEISFMYEMHKASLFYLVEAVWTILWFLSFCRSTDHSYIYATVFDLVKAFTKIQIFKEFSLSNNRSSVYFYVLIFKTK